MGFVIVGVVGTINVVLLCHHCSHDCISLSSIHRRQRLLDDGTWKSLLLADRNTVVSDLGDPRRERQPALYGHVINAPTDTFQR